MSRNIRCHARYLYCCDFSPSPLLLAMSTSGAIVISDNVNVGDILDFLVTAPGREDCDDGFYAMDINKVAERYQKWVELLPRIRPFYVVKCNPDPVLLRLLSKLGSGFDCSSKGEIRLVIEQGVNPQDIIYAHTCKKLSHIRFAKQCGVSMMTFDCEAELHKIKETHPESEILLRFQPSNVSARYETNALKFGVPLRDCKDLLMIAKSLGLNVVGVSFHVGSDNIDAKPYSDAVKGAKTIFDIGEKVGFSFNILNIGGGFPGKESEYPFEKICDVVNSALDKYFPVGCGVRIIAEPGRYFACSPYTLVTNVTTVKEIKKHQLQENEKENSPVPLTEEGQETGYMYYVDDGVFGSFIEVLYMFDDLEYIPKPLGETDDILFSSYIWGQTLDTLVDRISKICMLPKLSVGDWLYFENMGAYTLALSTNFNGFPMERYTYYYVTPKTWETIKTDMEEFDFDILKF